MTVYDETGHFQKNDLNAYSLNSITMKKEPDGWCRSAAAMVKRRTAFRSQKAGTTSSATIRPRKEILDGTWKFPEARPVD
jgi:hypothetical protein